MTWSEKTQALAAQAGKAVRADLKPQGLPHAVRMVGAIIVAGLGATDIIIHRFIHHEPWEKEPIALVILGAGILFTKTVVDILKAMLPWKSRNG